MKIGAHGYDQVQIRQLASEGFTDLEISQKLNIVLSCVQSFTKKKTVPINNPEPEVEPEPAKEVKSKTVKKETY